MTYWPDHFPSDKPFYTTRIPAQGSNGGILTVLSTARSLLRQCDHDESDLDELTRRVKASEGYEAALVHLRAWFPIDTDDDE